MTIRYNAEQHVTILSINVAVGIVTGGDRDNTKQYALQYLDMLSCIIMYCNVLSHIVGYYVQ